MVELRISSAAENRPDAENRLRRTADCQDKGDIDLQASFVPDGISYLAGIRARWLTGGFVHSTSRFFVNKYVILNCVFMLVQLNKFVVVCGSALQGGNSGNGCLSSSILLKYERSMGQLFVISWARVRWVVLGSVVLE